jgi:hypothetical protein
MNQALYGSFVELPALQSIRNNERRKKCIPSINGIYAYKI